MADPVLRLRRAQDSEIGDSAFDNEFVLLGGDAEHRQRLHRDIKFRAAIWLALSDGVFRVEPRQLYFAREGIADLERLLALHKLFEETSN